VIAVTGCHSGGLAQCQQGKGGGEKISTWNRPSARALGVGQVARRPSAPARWQQCRASRSGRSRARICSDSPQTSGAPLVSSPPSFRAGLHAHTTAPPITCPAAPAHLPVDSPLSPQNAVLEWQPPPLLFLYTVVAPSHSSADCFR
jgi:hypothetical protein